LASAARQTLQLFQRAVMVEKTELVLQASARCAEP
jgi:hypothetical protein